MRSAAPHLLALAVLIVPACEPVVEPIPHGTILCEVTAECDDSNDCSEDVCRSGRCEFTWANEGKPCVDEDDAAGICSAGVCHL